jgi:D-alanyl-D-alanine carboxypeptidase
MSSRQVHTHWITASGREGSTGEGAARFPYWSFTKTVIAIAALKLAEEGALDLDAPVDGPIKGQNHTLRHLLAHTSGLPDYGRLAGYHADVARRTSAWPRRKMLDLALAGGTLFQPGEGWSYSNIGYMLVRERIEDVTGKPLGMVLSDLLFEPLGLPTIGLAETREEFAGLHWDAAAAYDPKWVYHGCLTGTASDAARLLHTLFAGDLLRPGMLDRMRAARFLGGPIPGRPWTECGYALGLMSGAVAKAGKALGHSGAGPFSVNAVYHFPDVADPITVACFTDGTNEGIAEFAATEIADGS